MNCLKWIQQIMFCSQEKLVLLYNFCKYYMFIFDQKYCVREKKCIISSMAYYITDINIVSHVSNQKKIFSSIHYFWWSTPKLSGAPKLQAAVKLEAENFPKLFSGGLCFEGIWLIWRNWIILGEATLMEN